MFTSGRLTWVEVLAGSKEIRVKLRDEEKTYSRSGSYPDDWI
jgi:hypothetical protein